MFVNSTGAVLAYSYYSKDQQMHYVLQELVL